MAINKNLIESIAQLSAPLTPLRRSSSFHRIHGTGPVPAPEFIVVTPMFRSNDSSLSSSPYVPSDDRRRHHGHGGRRGEPGVAPAGRHLWDVITGSTMPTAWHR